MRRHNIVVLVSLLVVLVTVSAMIIGLNHHNKPAAVDVVNGIAPVSREMWDIQEVLDKLKVTPKEQRAALLQTMVPTLKEKVIEYQKKIHHIPAGAKNLQVTFKYGDADNVSAQNAKGDFINGYFRDQLIAEISYKVEYPGEAVMLTTAEAEPVVYRVVVKCLNGLSIPLSQQERLQDLGAYHDLLVIHSGRGLMDEVKAEKALALAEQYGLRLYAYSVDPANRISSREAHAYIAFGIKVVVLVHEGDTFDLTDGTRTHISNL